MCFSVCGDWNEEDYSLVFTLYQGTCTQKKNKPLKSLSVGDLFIIQTYLEKMASKINTILYVNILQVELIYKKC